MRLNQGHARQEGRVRLDENRSRPLSVPHAGALMMCLGLLGVLAGASAAQSLPASSTAGSAPAGTSPDDAAGSQPSVAETPAGLEAIDLYDLEVPMVVTAARHEQRVTDVPSAMSVITAEDIRMSGARTVVDALRLAPGVDVAELSWNTAAVNIRGHHELLSRELLVLVDGRQIFDSLFGGTHWGGWPFMLEDVERIEIIRGPAGVTWGPNAVNGVINIITKDPARQKGVTVTGGGGTQGAFKEYTGYGYQDEKLRMRVSEEFEGSSGFQKGGSFLHGLKDDLKAVRSNVHAIYDAGPNDRLTLSGGNSTSKGGFAEAPLSSFFRHKEAEMHGSFAMARLDHKINADDSFYLNTYVNDSYIQPASHMIEYRYQQLALQFGHTLKPVDDHTFTWGLDSRTDLLDATNADPQLLQDDYLTTGTVGLYGQDEWRFAERWMLTLGGRVDYECYGGFGPRARAALSYQIDKNNMVFGSVSRAFQSPPLGLRFLESPFLDGLAYVNTRDKLQPETLIAYELGYRGRHFEKVQTSAVVFCHAYDDMNILKLRPGPPGLLQQSVENGYSSTIYGFELESRYDISKRLTLLGNYTFEALDILGNGTLRETDRISPPRHKFMVGTRYSPLDALHLSAHLYFVDDVVGPSPMLPQILNEKIESYYRLDLRAEYEFWKDRASVSVGARNLLNDHHMEGTTQYQESAQVPRMVYAEIRTTLN